MTVAVLLSLLQSCGEASPKFITSGSSGGVSNLSFIPYFINPLSDPVIAIENVPLTSTAVADPAQNTSALEPHSNSLTTQEIFTEVTEKADTVKSSIDPTYCRFYAAAFSRKTPISRFYHASTNDTVLATVAPLVAERAYLELMRNYCYSNVAFHLDNTQTVSENNDKYGKVFWYKNQSLSLGGNKKFDFLVSQSNKDNTFKVLSVFQRAQTTTAKIGNESLYGKLHFTQNGTNERELNLTRYFVDDLSKTHAVPQRFRLEGYAMSTANNNQGTIHNVATFMLNYVANHDANASNDAANGFVIHANQFVIHSSLGAKLITANYCVYNSSDVASYTDILLASTTTYSCDTAQSIQKKTLSSKINNSGITGNAVDTGYYDVSGKLLKQYNGKYSPKDTKTIQALEQALEGTKRPDLLSKLSQKIFLQRPLGKKITLDQLNNELFDTSSVQSHLKFDQ